MRCPYFLPQDELLSVVYVGLFLEILISELLLMTAIYSRFVRYTRVLVKPLQLSVPQTSER